MAYTQVVAVTPPSVSNVNVGAGGPGFATLDGVPLPNPCRILLTNQTITPSQNGVWIWSGAGNALQRPAAATHDQYFTGNVFDNATVIWVTGAPGAAGE